MESGDIYWADVPFNNRPGSKIRPVVILDADPVPTVLVITSTSRFKSNLKLIHSIDFDSPRYRGLQRSGLRGASYFYSENIIELETSQLVRFVGALKPQDLEVIQSKLP